MTTKPKKMATKRKTVLVLRTCNADMTAHGGFKWPTSGPVKCSDWNPEPVCGGGLHGLLWGQGNGDLLNWDSTARWLVVEVAAASVVEIDNQKCKFPRGNVVFCGAADEAVKLIAASAPAGTVGVWGTATAGVRGTATAGDGGTATAGDGGTATAGDRGTATAGDGGTATAGDWGTATAGVRGTATAGVWGTATAGVRGTATAGVRGTATAGDWGTATAGDGGTATAGDGGTATAGDRGTATAGDWGTATAGDGGTATAGVWGTATAGVWGTATAGVRGTICIRWWDGKHDRYRTAVGYVGENGLVAGVGYCWRDGKFEKAKP